MTNPVVFKGALSVGLLHLTQSIALPAIAVVSLLADRWYFDVGFDQHFAVLLMLVAMLGTALLQPQSKLIPQLIDSRRQLVLRTGLRWLLLLFSLLAIGYATKSSGYFSRRMLLTWAVTTPGLLIGVALLIRKALEQMLSDPNSARRAVLVG